MALIGQISFPVFPRQRLQPCLKGSVLDCLILTWILLGDSRLSREMSWRDRWTAGEYSSCDGTVNSLHLRKPKKASEQAAHIMMLLWSVGFLISVHLSLSIISTVMGSQVRGFTTVLSFLMPFSTISSLGISCFVNSLCRSAVTCRLWTADRYTLMVWWAKPC